MCELNVLCSYNADMQPDLLAETLDHTWVVCTSTRFKNFTYTNFTSKPDITVPHSGAFVKLVSDYSAGKHVVSTFVVIFYNLSINFVFFITNVSISIFYSDTLRTFYRVGSQSAKMHHWQL